MILGGLAVCQSILNCLTPCAKPTACMIYIYPGLTNAKLYWFKSLAAYTVANNTAVAPFI